MPYDLKRLNVCKVSVSLNDIISDMMYYRSVLDYANTNVARGTRGFLDT